MAPGAKPHQETLRATLKRGGRDEETRCACGPGGGRAPSLWPVWTGVQVDTMTTAMMRTIQVAGGRLIHDTCMWT